jgi:phosphatidylglycerophosphatase GEP4
MPHVAVQRIHQLNWAAFARLGFKGCVLDKDNTLTKPYSMVLEPLVQESLTSCLAAFKGNVVVFSNSAGEQVSILHRSPLQACR